MTKTQINQKCFTQYYFRFDSACLNVYSNKPQVRISLVYMFLGQTIYIN